MTRENKKNTEIIEEKYEEIITGQIDQNRCAWARNVTGKCARNQEQIEMKSYKERRKVDKVVMITIILHEKRNKSSSNWWWEFVFVRVGLKE